VEKVSEIAEIIPGKFLEIGLWMINSKEVIGAQEKDLENL
jgi:hypothetical protein